MEMFYIFIAGATGALLKDILEDACLTLPSIKSGKFFPGFIGGIIVGGTAGYFIDGSFITAFIAGYTGSSVIQNLIAKKLDILKEKELTPEEQIRRIATEEGVDPDFVIKVAKCESNLNTKAINLNKDGSNDRGIFQINNKWHPEVTDKQAFDIEFSTRFFCKAFKEGNLSWWNASKDCWNK